MTYEFSYMPIMHCETCGNDWIPKDETDIQCPIETKLVSKTKFRKMCAEYFGRNEDDISNSL